MPSPCPQGSWKLGVEGGLYPQKQIPVASVLGIFISLSYTSQSFPESFGDMVSLLWNPTESFPCYLSASTWGKKSLSSGTLV